MYTQTGMHVDKQRDSDTYINTNTDICTCSEVLCDVISDRGCCGLKCVPPIHILKCSPLMWLAIEREVKWGSWVTLIQYK